jgi:hypothetical protein
VFPGALPGRLMLGSILQVIAMHAVHMLQNPIYLPCSRFRTFGHFTNVFLNILNALASIYGQR